jgi:hypothetical protein
MKRAVLALLIFAAAMTALADDVPRPDYSREALLRAFGPLPPHGALPPGRVQWHVGWFEFRALGMSWRVAYLPIMAPLPGARLQDGAKIPNAFELTGTPYASTLPPMFDHDRPWAVEREYRRIQRLTARAK